MPENHTILVVDDTPELLDLLARILTSEGFLTSDTTRSLTMGKASLMDSMGTPYRLVPG